MKSDRPHPGMKWKLRSFATQFWRADHPALPCASSLLWPADVFCQHPSPFWLLSKDLGQCLILVFENCISKYNGLHLTTFGVQHAAYYTSLVIPQHSVYDWHCSNKVMEPRDFFWPFYLFHILWQTTQHTEVRWRPQTLSEVSFTSME